MDIKVTHKSNVVKGEIKLTSSKSISNRVLIIQALCADGFEIENLAAAEDTQVLQRLLASNESILDVGLAGTTMRFLTAYLSLKEGVTVLTGAKRMKERPIKVLVEALGQLGADISYEENIGYPPLKISGGKLDKDELTIGAGVSSQYISALLLIAPKLENGLKLTLAGDLISKPYIDMTIAIMQYFGAEVKWNKNTIEVKPGFYIAKDFIVEADWSAASYWYGIAALATEADITLYGLQRDSLQGDAAVVDIYKNFGVETIFIDGGIRLLKPSNFKCQTPAINYNFSNCPDIAQTVAVTCAALNIEAHFTGLITLRIKETDRIEALHIELTKLGFKLDVDGDKLNVKSHGVLCSNQAVKTYHDHRMAMAFAPLALLAEIAIEDKQVVEKSYPSFWEDLQVVGFDML